MSVLLGYWLIILAISGFVVFACGWELDLKTKVMMVIGIQVFVGLLEIGLSLMFMH